MDDKRFAEIEARLGKYELQTRGQMAADIRGLLTALKAETARADRYKALHEHLPEGYAIGDDATAELAVELTAANEKLAAARKIYSDFMLDDDFDYQRVLESIAALLNTGDGNGR